MEKQIFKVCGKNIAFDPSTDPDNAFINALAEASEAERRKGADAGLSALKGALSIGLMFGIRPTVDGQTIQSRGDISATIDGKLEGIGDGAEGAANG